MTDNIILTSIPEERFKEIFREIFQERIPSPQTPIDNLHNDLMTENEARDFLRVSKVSLSKWRKENKIKFYRIGTRIRYKRSDLETAIESGKKFGRVQK